MMHMNVEKRIDLKREMLKQGGLQMHSSWK